MSNEQTETVRNSSFAEAISRSYEFSQEGMTFFLAGKSYFKKGGSSAEFKRIIARLLNEANIDDDAEIQFIAPEKAVLTLSPASSPQANGSDQFRDAKTRRLVPVTPVREPSAADIASLESIREQSAGVIFDTFKMRDGRKIGDVRYGELLRLETADRVEAEIIKHIRERGTAAHDTPVRLLIKPKLLATIIRNAKEKYHAA